MYYFELGEKMDFSDKWGRKTKVLLIVVLFFCLLGALCLKYPVTANATDYQTVKVGYYQSPKFQEGDGKKTLRSGYGYEYLQKIASYTGWKYEYISGDWEELYQKLRSGQIDLLAGVSYEKNREDQVLFSDSEILKETFYIYKDSNDSSMQSGNYASYNGKKIGVVKDRNMQKCIQSWMQKNQVDATLLEYDDIKQCADAFNSQKIDAFVSADNIVSGYTGITPVDMIGKVPYYLCVSNGKTDILQELNTAISLINGQDSIYLSNLKNKYSADTSISIFLTRQERSWLESHKSVTVGYLDNYMPYSDSDASGNVRGLLKDMLEDIFDSLPGSYHPDISYISFKSQDDMLVALKNHSVDLVFPVGGELPYAEQNGYQQSSNVIQAAIDLVYTGSYDDTKTARIAVNKNNNLQLEFTKIYYPDSELIYCDSAQECIRKVKKNQADSTLIEALRAVKLAGEDKKLEMVPVSDTCDFCFGVDYGNSDLLRILNHGLSILGDDYGLSHAYRYIGDIVSDSSHSFIVRYRWFIYVLISALGILILFVFILRYRMLQKLSHTEEKYNKTLQDALMKAEKANYAKQLFLNNISHDIRTPLNVILGMNEINQRSDDPELLQHNYKKVSVAGKELLTMLDHMIELHNLNEGEFLDLREEVNLQTLTDRVAEDIKKYASGKSVMLVHERTQDASTWPLVYGNTTCIQEILQHILENAVKYNHENGQVHWGDEVKLTDSGQAEYTAVISDTGIGMNETYLKHIFEPFSQERYGARTSYMGNGMGMAIVKMLLDQMHGLIRIKSREGKGTEVFLCIPLEICIQGEQPRGFYESDTKTGCPLSGKKILLAEDNDLNIEIIQFMLEEAGAEVTVTQNGQEALTAYLDAPAYTYALVLMDLMMPVMDGYEAINAIRSSGKEDAKALCIIALTACVTKAARESCEAAGTSAFLEKPLDMKKLVQILEKIW